MECESSHREKERNVLRGAEAKAFLLTVLPGDSDAKAGELLELVVPEEGGGIWPDKSTYSLLLIT